MKTHIAIIFTECGYENAITNLINSVKLNFSSFSEYTISCNKVFKKDDFAATMEQIGHNYQDYDRIFIDIECHGNNFSLSLNKEINADFIKWDELYKLCKAIKSKLKGELCLILSSCLSLGYAAYLHNNSIKDACNYIMCTGKTIQGLSSTDALEMFFKYIENDCDIITAHNNTIFERYCMHNKDSFIEVNPYELFVF